MDDKLYSSLTIMLELKYTPPQRMTREVAMALTNLFEKMVIASANSQGFKSTIKDFKLEE